MKSTKNTKCPVGEKSTWQKEFPRTFFLIKEPKAFFKRLFFKTERFIRKSIVIATVILMGYLIYKVFQNNFVMVGGGMSIFKQDYLLKVWKVYRNVLYLFLFIDFILSSIIIFIRLTKNQIAKALKQFLLWYSTLLLVTFSFAIAGLIVDLIFLAIFIHIGLMGPGTEVLGIGH